MENSEDREIVRNVNTYTQGGRKARIYSHDVYGTGLAYSSMYSSAYSVPAYQTPIAWPCIYFSHCTIILLQANANNN